MSYGKKLCPGLIGSHESRFLLACLCGILGHLVFQSSFPLPLQFFMKDDFVFL